jgi:hypothetical protein
VEVLFIPAQAATAKCNWVKDSVILCDEEVETIARHELGDQLKRDVIITRLPYNVPEAFSKEICAKDSQFCRIKSSKTWTQQDRLP